MKQPWLVLVASLGIAAALIAFVLPKSPPSAPTPNKPLLMFCAAGIKPPAEAVARQYEQAYGIRVQLQYGGSGTLLSNLRLAEAGDLFLAADETYIQSADTMGLIAASIPLARQQPVLAVPKGNPKRIRTLEDLLQTGVRVALANPDAASIGRTVRNTLQKTGQWTALEKQVIVFKPTVNDVANDIKLGSVDAGIVWDATARQSPELDLVPLPVFSSSIETIHVCLLKRSRQPTAAWRFARYLAARDKGLPHFKQFHYQSVAGDLWAETPEIILFSGAMLRPGLEKTLKEFEQREGCRITTVYNGCGVLVAQMRAGQRPDAYFSCDTSFMRSVADLYLDPVQIVDNHLMIIVQKGNPKGIKTVQDLTQPGLRVGLPHHEKSAMGNITWKMLLQMNLYDALAPNLKVQSPTGDFLINQIRTGSLDAIIACRSNWTAVREHLDAMPIDHPTAHMIQPYAVGRQTSFPQLLMRLQKTLTTGASRQRFLAEGFGWRYQSDPHP